MIELFDGSDKRFEEILKFRERAYAASRRNQEFSEAWKSDKYDSGCYHLSMKNTEGNIIAAVRMSITDHWPLEDRFNGDINKDEGIEFGRLGVFDHNYNGKKTLYELMGFAARSCIEWRRPYMYGLIISPFKSALQKRGVPLRVLSKPIYAYGEEQNIVLLDARELVDFCDSYRKL